MPKYSVIFRGICTFIIPSTKEAEQVDVYLPQAPAHRPTLSIPLDSWEFPKKSDPRLVPDMVAIDPAGREIGIFDLTSKVLGFGDTKTGKKVQFEWNPPAYRVPGSSEKYHLSWLAHLNPLTSSDLADSVVNDVFGAGSPCTTHVMIHEGSLSVRGLKRRDDDTPLFWDMIPHRGESSKTRQCLADTVVLELDQDEVTISLSDPAGTITLEVIDDMKICISNLDNFPQESTGDLLHFRHHYKLFEKFPEIYIPRSEDGPVETKNAFCPPALFVT